MDNAIHGSDIPTSMKAMIFDKPGSPLRMTTMPVPEPQPGQMLIKVTSCGICRTDLHVVDGELPHPKLPLVPGHEVIGVVVKIADNKSSLNIGDIVGVPWLGYTCGHCRYCLRQQENLCENARFTGYTMDGGYAEYMVAYESFVYPMDKAFAGPEAAPLLCAGLIGYRSFVMTGQHVKKLGIYGFGAAAHIIIQVARYKDMAVYAFTRDGDSTAQKFALDMGAVWAGNSSVRPPVTLDAAIIFAPAGELIPLALQSVDKGGTVVCGGIHMSDIPSFPYRLLWEERIVRSVANLCRKDGHEFFALASTIPIHTGIQPFPLHQSKNIHRRKFHSPTLMTGTGQCSTILELRFLYKWKRLPFFGNTTSQSVG